MQEPFRYHRKLWEFCYVAQVLSKKGMLQPGKKGIGFGVGCEPLPALFAKYGCQILASDQDFGTAKEQGWVQSDQYSTEKAKLNKSNICDPSAFEQLVELITIDMNHIDQGLEGFDFTWSCCSLEHIGGLEAGLAFIINSIKCLRPGGVAIHTTEYNLSSNKDTIETPTLSVYRKKDIDSLIQRLEALGYTVAPLNLHRGRGKIDRFVDLPPYKLDPHLRLRLGKYDCTSIGIVIQK